MPSPNPSHICPPPSSSPAATELLDAHLRLERLLTAPRDSPPPAPSPPIAASLTTVPRPQGPPRLQATAASTGSTLTGSPRRPRRSRHLNGLGPTGSPRHLRHRRNPDGISTAHAATTLRAPRHRPRRHRRPEVLLHTHDAALSGSSMSVPPPRGPPRPNASSTHVAGLRGSRHPRHSGVLSLSLSYPPLRSAVSFIS